MRRLPIALLLVALGLSWPAQARANGRYPSADQLVTDPADATHLLLRTTFGLLVSHDAGLSWRWVCENAVGYGGGRDPALAIFPDGSVAAGFARALRVSRADGCGWESPFSNVTAENFVDATSDPGDPTNILFLSRTLAATRLLQVFVANGSTLTALEAPLGDDLSPITLEVAPSLPSRIYVTAFAADLTTVLVRSDDRGKTWQRLAIHPDETLPAYIAAVDPTNPDRLYLRLDGTATDVLLVSDDGGVHFKEALSLDTDLLGFAISPDGTRLAVGGPTVGLFLADTASLAFEQSPAHLANLSCLKWTDTALLACGRESTDGFTVARSEDAGRSFAPLFHLGALSPLTCEATTDVGSLCPSLWPAVAQTLGLDAGATAGSGSGLELTPAGGHCGCALPGQERPPLAIATLVLFGGVLLRRNRRRARSSDWC